MKKYEIVRFESIKNNKAVIGKLIDVRSSKRLCYTLELPYRNNQRNISSVPDGKYLVKSKYSPTKGRVFELQDVPNRTYIYIHVGNMFKDTQGCILVGKKYNSSGLLYSRDAMGKLLLDLPDKFMLTLRTSTLLE